MRNFMGYDRRWLDEPHVGDHVGSTIWALGEILATAWIPALSGPARTLLGRTRAIAPRGRLVADRRLHHSRPRAPRSRSSRPRREVLLERLVEQLASAYHGSAAGSWLWFETDSRTTMRGSPRPSSSGIGTPTALRRCHWARVARMAGRRMRPRRGMLRLPGHHGRDRDEPAPGQGDEQPLDATAFVEAELAALVATGDGEHGARARNAFDWFLGRNRLDRPLYDFATGGCSDGLGETDLNENQGAESTLPSIVPSCCSTPPPSRLPTDARSGPKRRDVEPRGVPAPCRQPDRLPPTGASRSTPSSTLRRRSSTVKPSCLRVEDRRGISHLGVARSADGLSGWSIAPEPLLAPADGIESEQWGFEDPRAVWVAELERWLITCTAYGPSGPAVYLASTTDFRTVERIGIICQPEDKNAAVLSERVDGQWVLFHRPMTSYGGSRGEVVSPGRTT